MNVLVQYVLYIIIPIIGGGKANRILQDPIISRVITLIRPQVEALSNEFDSDHLEITTPSMYCINI